ncbi:MAG: ABC transporter ATP-binding protein, partial [Planctomycetota bacterium]
QAVLPLVGLAAEKVIRDRYISGGWICPGGKPPGASRPPVGRTRGGESHPRPVYPSQSAQDPMSNIESKTFPLLETRQLTMVYADGAVTALAGIDLGIEHGEFVAIMGPSGSGKSTLLHMLGALDVPTSGEVLFEGVSLSEVDSLDRIRSKEIGFVFQSFYLLPNLTAAENVQLPMFECSWEAAERSRRAFELLETVGMSPRATQLPMHLSVGERQRVAIARALANEPAVLLADEPTGNLDSRTGGEILDLFRALHERQGRTIVMVTHDIEVAEKARRLVRVRDGRIESDERLPGTSASRSSN